MLKNILIIITMALVVVACDRAQKNTNMIMNKEVPEDFTTQPQVNTPTKSITPMLPGKAQIIGAPFADFPTQTGSATVLPSENKTVLVPVETPQ